MFPDFKEVPEKEFKKYIEDYKKKHSNCDIKSQYTMNWVEIYDMSRLTGKYPRKSWDSADECHIARYHDDMDGMHYYILSNDTYVW